MLGNSKYTTFTNPNLTNLRLEETLKRSQNSLRFLYNGIGAAVPLSRQDLQKIAKVIEANPSLEEIDLSSNKIDDEGLKIIVNPMKSAESLVQVNLMNNCISDIGAKEIAELIKCNPKIEKVHLGHNDITDIGARMIINAVGENCHTKTISLGYTSVKQEALDEIAILTTPDQMEYRKAMMTLKVR